MTNILLEWRRMQRKGWQYLLYNKHNELQAQDMCLVYSLLEVFSNQDARQLAVVLQQYVSSSKVGTFTKRLQVVLVVAELALQKQQIQTYYILYNTYIYYSQFLLQYHQVLKDSYTSCIKDIEEYEQLQGWHSNNYHVLRATSDKFHKRLNKIVKNYQEVLHSSISNIVINKAIQSYYVSAVDVYPTIT